MASLKCFGVGDGWPCAERFHSSYLYRFGQAGILIDCGEPLSRSYKASGLGYDLVDRMLLSHLHFDHAGGFFMLIQGFWLEGRKKELVVHTPSDGLKTLPQMLHAGCILDELLPFRLQFVPIQASERIVQGNVRVTPYPTTHLANLRAAYKAKYPFEFTSFSFVLETEQVRIGHSADIGSIEDLLPLVEKPLDLLVCELAHVAPSELFRFLKGRPIKQLVLVHLSRQCRAEIERIRDEAIKVLAPVSVLLPKDGDEVEIPERTKND